MAESSSDYRTTAQGAAVTMANRPDARNVLLPGDLPGVVIFIHGVNDPGAVYSVVEQGLCQGLNDRLSRTDLRPGEYGSAYHAAAKKKKSDRTAIDDLALADPDTYLYQRTETANITHSVFLPFYWGLRVDNTDIAKVDKPGVVTSRDADANGNLMTRGQYQDVNGNRLDVHFAKAGGFFDNATNNIPDMYGPGFKSTPASEFVTKHPSVAMSNTLYAGTSPDRRYFVLAATRLANLIRTIRAIQPNALAEAHGINPAHETVTVLGHSQGTIITLLAQAILKQQGQRCVDCIIMVDTPYGLYETGSSNQSGQAKLKTLVDIVNAVTEKPYSVPDLAEMLVGHEKHGGRAGPGWTPKQGKRLDETGKQWITFDERDNRGKVYLYFCPEDTVVGLADMHGIGTFGVPDTVAADGTAAIPGAKTGTVPAMNALAPKRFFQRMWTRMERDHNFDGKFEKVKVGLKPARVPVRESDERMSPGPDVGPAGQGWASQQWGATLNMGANAGLQARFQPTDIRYINGEELKPPCVPDLYGGEVIHGGPRPGYADVAGLVAPDDVTKNVALGNQYANLNWKTVEGFSLHAQDDLERLKTEFNANKSVDDQSQNWRLTQTTVPILGPFGPKVSYGVEREETPNEARARMETDRKAYDGNNYHSAVLHSAKNHRWVTAMDVAIGQAVTLDDPAWRSLLIMMADWKMDGRKLGRIQSNPNFRRLDADTQNFISACSTYYLTGTFPEKYVSGSCPPLVTSEQKPSAVAAQKAAEDEYYKQQAQQAQMMYGNKSLGEVFQGLPR